MRTQARTVNEVGDGRPRQTLALTPPPPRAAVVVAVVGLRVRLRPARYCTVTAVSPRQTNELR